MFKVSSSPHIRHKDTTTTIMTDVLIALSPALLWSIYVFGWRSLTIVLISVISAVVSEYLFERAVKRDITIKDMSAAVTGVLVAFNLPVTAPLWMPVIGSAFAIIVVKQLFGGIGKNFANPALAARVFLLSWPGLMQSFVAPMTKLPAFAFSTQEYTVDVVTSATSLGALKSGVTADYSLLDNFYGFVSGCIGEVSAMMLLLGFVYLLIRKVITSHITLSYIGTVAVFMFLYAYLTGNNDPLNFAATQIFSGGLMLGAIFMATDYSSSPIMPAGKIIFGIGCGLITSLIRLFGGYPEGVSFAILVMNTLVWFIDKWTRPKVFGAINVKMAKVSK